MKITDAFRHLSIVLELLEAVDRTRDLMYSLHSSLPHDRHFIQFWRAISDQNHTFHNAPHDLFAINRRCAFGVPDLRDTFRERADAMPLVRAEGRRLLRQKTIVFLLRFALPLQGFFPARFERACDEPVFWFRKLYWRSARVASCCTRSSLWCH